MVLERSRRLYLISGSCVVAAALVFFAYISSGPTPFTTRFAGAESTHDLLVAYASKDTDSDGLPDWEEALYGTDPSNAHSVDSLLSDSAAVAQGLVKPRFETATTTVVDAKSLPGVDAGPTTLTDEFAKKLFGQYLKTRGGAAPSAEEISAFVEQGVGELIQSQSQATTYNLGQVSVVGTGPDVLAKYARDIEPILMQVDKGKVTDEIQSFSDAVNKGDQKALTRVQTYAEAYSTAARAVMKINVPQELSANHLRIANDLAHTSNALRSMAKLTTDPLAAMVGIASYTVARSDGLQALGEMNAVYKTEGVSFAPEEAGAYFYGLTIVGSRQQ